MNEGFWNYTERVFWRVVTVKLFAVKEPAMHWQNAFINQQRQAIEVSHGKHIFYIDNGDGSGMLKIKNGGGPGNMHRNIEAQCFEIVEHFPPREIWMQWDPTESRKTDEIVEAWQKEHFPAEFEKLQRLKAAWSKSDMNPRSENFKFK